MTTIAYDGRLLAIDEYACYLDYSVNVTARKCKVLRRDDEQVYAFGTGDLHQVAAIWAWLERRIPEYPRCKDATVITVNNRGVIAEYGAYPAPYEVCEEVPHAWGSGAQAAMVAIRLFGLSATKAIAAASSVDIYTSKTGWYLDLTCLESGFLQF